MTKGELTHPLITPHPFFHFYRWQLSGVAPLGDRSLMNDNHEFAVLGE